MVYVSSDVAERIKAVAKSKNIPLKSLLDKVGLGVNTTITARFTLVAQMGSATFTLTVYR